MMRCFLGIVRAFCFLAGVSATAPSLATAAQFECAKENRITVDLQAWKAGLKGLDGNDTQSHNAALGLLHLPPIALGGDMALAGVDIFKARLVDAKTPTHIVQARYSDGHINQLRIVALQPLLARSFCVLKGGVVAADGEACENNPLGLSFDFTSVVAKGQESWVLRRCDLESATFQEERQVVLHYFVDADGGPRFLSIFDKPVWVQPLGGNVQAINGSEHACISFQGTFPREIHYAHERRCDEGTAPELDDFMGAQACDSGSCSPDPCESWEGCIPERATTIYRFDPQNHGYLKVVPGVRARKRTDTPTDKASLKVLLSSTGAKFGEGTCRDDEAAGLWTFWDAKGRVAAKGAYAEGVKDGFWLETVRGKQTEQCYRAGDQVEAMYCEME